MQMSRVVTQSATNMPVAERTTGGGKRADVKEVIRRNQELFTQILGFLVHTVYTNHVLPSVPLSRLIVKIVVQGVQFEVQTALIIVLILLSSVLLITHKHFQRAVANEQGVIPHRLIVVDLLEG